MYKMKTTKKHKIKSKTPTWKTYLNKYMPDLNKNLKIIEKLSKILIAIMMDKFHFMNFYKALTIVVLS